MERLMFTEEEQATSLTEIGRLEAPLREAHAAYPYLQTFQDFVRNIRASATHPLHTTAVAYNQAVYELQKRYRC